MVAASECFKMTRLEVFGDETSGGRIVKIHKFKASLAKLLPRFHTESDVVRDVTRIMPELNNSFRNCHASG
jgi:hypothetical protein